MNPDEIINLLNSNYYNLNQFFDHKPADFFTFRPSVDKWTAGQHVVHLVQSEEALLKALAMPMFLLKWKFGKSNRPSRTFEEVVHRYNEKLRSAGNVVSPFSKNMPEVNSQNLKSWLDKLKSLNDKLNQKTKALHEKELDTVILPHPLMGKLILREMLMWNAYHTAHHLHILKEKYAGQ
ncbi:MAG: DinB family protein [Saprospiraceae bacterium]|nr:DinB family protein [Saprospiraceae bacterium]